MESVRSNDEVEFTFGTVLKRDADASRLLVNSRNAIAEDRLDLAFDGTENGGRQVAAGEADKAALRRAGKHLWRKSGYSLPA